MRMKAIDYTHLFWACGVMHIDPCNGLMLAKLAHGVTAIAHQFSVQVTKFTRMLYKMWDFLMLVLFEPCSSPTARS